MHSRFVHPPPPSFGILPSPTFFLSLSSLAFGSFKETHQLLLLVLLRWLWLASAALPGTVLRLLNTRCHHATKSWRAFLQSKENSCFFCFLPTAPIQMICEDEAKQTRADPDLICIKYPRVSGGLEKGIAE